MLILKDLQVSIEGKELLAIKEMEVEAGEVVALMGANGSGKSSLAMTLMGSEQYQVTSGEVIFGGKDLLKMEVSDRARAGLLVLWQNPVVVFGVSVLSYLRIIYEASGNKIAKMTEFRDQILELLTKVGLSKETLSRNLNEGFSGGEKKRFELLQALLLRPKLIIMDEIDSGLDVDGLREVAKIVKELSQSGVACLLITHYKKLLEYVLVDKVMVLANGRLAASGGHELVEKIEKEGYRGLSSNG